MLKTTSVADWRSPPGSVRWLPAMATAPAPALPESWEDFWTTPRSALFESGRSGRWTVLVPELEPWPEATTTPADALAGLDAWQQKNSGLRVAGDWPEFQGGLAVLLSYDLVRAYEPVPSLAANDLETPPLLAGFAREALVYDHVEKTVTAIVLGERGARAADALHADCLERAKMLLRLWFAAAQRPAAPLKTEAGGIGGLTATFDQASFCTAVRRIQDYITAGDTYQVNLSLRQSFPLKTTPERIYEALRRVNPSPYMGLLRMPELTLVCGSPELLVRANGVRIEARPIAGTRPRGEAPEADRTFLEELRDNEKEKAEHLMLVDLLRNDLGRVAKRGTVGVDEFMAIEQYSHVMHLVSHVSGGLAAVPLWSEVIRAVFPGGTITGAPKVRTMQIIEEVEPVWRGGYTGALGWLGLDGSLNLNIIIRSMVVKNGTGHVQAGAGIVADSIPEREYEESLNKAKALLRAVSLAE